MQHSNAIDRRPQYKIGNKYHETSIIQTSIIQTLNYLNTSSQSCIYACFNKQHQFLEISIIRTFLLGPSYLGKLNYLHKPPPGNKYCIHVQGTGQQVEPIIHYLSCLNQDPAFTILIVIFLFRILEIALWFIFMTNETWYKVFL